MARTDRAVWVGKGRTGDKDRAGQRQGKDSASARAGEGKAKGKGRSGERQADTLVFSVGHAESQLAHNLRDRKAGA